jgi:signal transduction histidine kinase
VWTQLWRGVVAYRVAALAYAAALTLGVRDDFAHPRAALGVLAGMAAWTVLVTVANSRDRGRVWPVVLADHVVCAALTVASLPVQGSAEVRSGAPTLTTAWAAAPVLGSALLGGPWGGLAGALVQGAASVLVRGELTLATLGNVVLLLLAGGVGGYVAALAVAAERRLAEAVRLTAATRERERLARGIHDGVLQVLALVRRRGTELGGAGNELAALAGEQEVALRTLISTPPPAPVAAAAPGRAGRRTPTPVDGPVDLRALLAPYRSERVTVSGPAEPVLLAAGVGPELAAAVAAALDNVAKHAGDAARAWVLVEDLGGEVAVSVRDDGPGIPAGRLERAAAAGRLGVASSMRGRVSELGGTMSVHTVPGEGTEIEFRIPRGGQAWSG